ncbi:hypothetical protein [Streptomyces lydicus]|uniref:hypothetical protein n=1 Tax=Streptomyces lydicus TaxID=47763 RepID=UPI0036EE3D70
MAVKTTPGENRTYYKEEAPDTKYPGVTRIVGMLPKPFLQRWSANMAAELALDSIDYLQRMVDQDREGAKRYVAGAAYRYTDARAKIGSRAHDLFERMIRGERVNRVHPDLVMYQRHFAEFLAVVKPVLVRAEDVAWSDTHGYAGSFDAWLMIRVTVLPDGSWELDPDGHNPLSVWVSVIADWKTSKSVWASVALQMSAYAHADKIIAPDGTEEDMPAFDGAVVLHITPDGWDLIRVRIDREDVFAAFLHLRETLKWESTLSKTVLIGSLAKNKARQTGTQRRA